MTNKKSSQDIGKDFEKTLEGVFSYLQKSYGFRYHKFVDSHAAGNIVASQPSDYLVAAGSKMLFIEAKATATNKNFTRGVLRPAQRGAIMMYGQVLKVPYLILFYSEVTGLVSFIDGAKAMVGERVELKSCTFANVKISKLGNYLARHLELKPLSVHLKQREFDYGSQDVIH